jgi:hypothetical protein
MTSVTDSIPAANFQLQLPWGLAVNQSTGDIIFSDKV